jgi:hypothetical protein
MSFSGRPVADTGIEGMFQNLQTLKEDAFPIGTASSFSALFLSALSFMPASECLSSAALGAKASAVCCSPCATLRGGLYAAAQVLTLQRQFDYLSGCSGEIGRKHDFLRLYGVRHGTAGRFVMYDAVQKMCCLFRERMMLDIAAVWR